MNEIQVKLDRVIDKLDELLYELRKTNEDTRKMSNHIDLVESFMALLNIAKHTNTITNAFDADLIIEDVD